jgi:hypothetical protein
MAPCATDVAPGCGLEQQHTDRSLAPADAPGHGVLDELQGAEPMAVGILQNAVALVVQVLLVGRYPQIGKGGHEAFSEEMEVLCFLERIMCSLDQIQRASKNCTKDPFFRTDGRKVSASRSGARPW